MDEILWFYYFLRSLIGIKNVVLRLNPSLGGLLLYGEG